jgi:hypothetical protein
MLAQYRVLSLVIVLAAAPLSIQDNVSENFDTPPLPLWALLCASPGKVAINPSGTPATGGLVFDPIFGSGVLEVFVGPPNLLVYCGPGQTFTNFMAKTAARKSAGPAAGGTLAVVYGLVFRAQDSTFYWFAVSTAGYYGLFKFPAPGPRPMGTLSHPGVQIVPWTWDFNVAQGNASNTLCVEVQGQAAKLFVNGVLKQTVRLLADGPMTGQVALGIGTFELFPWAGVTVYFDYIFVNSTGSSCT